MLLNGEDTQRGAAFSSHPDDGEAALAVYEAAMFARSEAAAAAVHRMLALCLDERAPLSLAKFFTHAAAEVG